MSINFGVMFSFITGPYVPYHVLPFVIITLPIIFTIVTTFLPDVPSYLIKCGKIRVNIVLLEMLTMTSFFFNFRKPKDLLGFTKTVNKTLMATMKDLRMKWKRW